MDSSILQHRNIQRTKQKLKMTASRLVDHHVNLAVTGLSGSGKTAFITSLVNQLLEANEEANLPFFNVVREARLVGVKRDVQPNLTFRRFAYEDAMISLTNLEPVWPLSTKGISQVRLKIKYKKSSGVSKYLTKDATLTLDITDYPGEWLLDLPLLDMSYEQWIEHCSSELEDPLRAKLAKPFIDAISKLKLEESGDELALKNIADLYAQYLASCQENGFQLLQPGRFILPGELNGAPALHFFPLIFTDNSELKLNLKHVKKGSNVDLLISRFEHYKARVVQPFFQEHFRKFDRQVILVDCLSALNNGYNCYQDLQKAIDWILGSFQYGSSSILNRLFHPQIDKLVFAASKADHITPDQQGNLVKLLESMLRNARKKIQFKGVQTESTAIASIRASKSGSSELDGANIQVLQGQDENGNTITLFPGEVPQCCPPPNFWISQKFEFPKFSPPQLGASYSLPHIRMDQVLDFLLADKLA
ncbi:YcjX family protein [Paraglaciecola marina]|uniref:YcjX family protein n=2 Tax=Paraglaciecola TaxID=1621534 RepID=UPI00105F2364|nr:YcjX family protein [Paraglaciecola marina]